MNLRLVENLPTAEQYNAFRAAVGWDTHELAQAAAALPRSLYGVMAIADGEPAGMSRVVGDGGMVYYIQDVIVVPGFQRLGIGRKLMDATMAWIHAQPGSRCVIGLMAAKGAEGFYNRYGFTTRPNDQLGAGMTIFRRPAEPG